MTAQRCTELVTYAGVEWVCELEPGHDGEHWVQPVQVIR